jgi:hypothetical protein
MFDLLGEEKKRRHRISKTEWEAIKKRYKNRCILCGKTEKQVGELQKAHLKAASKGGSQVVPMCPSCHRKYDKGKATDRDLKKLGIDKKLYKRMMPKKTTQKKKDPFAIETPKLKIPKIGIQDPFGGSSRRGKRGSCKRKSKK